MQHLNSPLEISLQNSNTLPYYKLKSRELNLLGITIKNRSEETLVFESEYGVPSLPGSTEKRRPTCLFLCFGDLLSSEELKKIKLITPGWDISIEIREIESEVSYYVAFTPQKEVTVKVGKEFLIEFSIEPKGINEFSYLSIEVNDLKLGGHRKVLNTVDATFLFPVVIRTIQPKLKLVWGIVGDDIVYVSKGKSIRNHFTVYLINVGDEIDFSRTTFPRLRLKFSEGFRASQIALVDGSWNSVSNTGEFKLSGKWKAGGAKELTLNCTMNPVDWNVQNELIANLRIEVLDISGFKNHTFYMPMKLMLQKQIGSEALSIQINHELIHIK